MRAFIQHPSAPTRPGGLAVTPGVGSASLAWSDNSGGVASFVVERRPSGGEWAEVDTVGVGVVAYEDTLAAGDYEWRVRAEAGGFRSIPTRAVAETVASAPVLGTISDLAATVGDTQVALSWTAAANATSHQPQYRATGSGTWLDFGSALGGSASGVTVTGLTNGQAYEFRVVASDGSTTTASNTVTGTPTASSGAITMLHGVSGPISSTSQRIKFKVDADATGVVLAYSTDPTLATGVQYTAPQDLDASNYHTFDVTLDGLVADTDYYWAPYAGSTLAQFQGLYGHFKTAPVGPKTFSIAFSNCNQYTSGTPRDLTVWDHIREQAPAFFCHMDDFHYGDLTTTDVAPRVAADEQQMGMPRQGACYMRVPLVRNWGDHDFCGNDSYGGQGGGAAPGRFAAAESYRATMPHPPLSDTYGTYFAFTYGRVRFIKTDGRFYRDSRWYTGSDKSMLGTAQKAWFEAEIDQAAADVAAGDIALVVWLVDVPWSGVGGTNDDHWEGYGTERAELAEYIEQAGLTGNLYLLCGDMHRQGYDDGTNTRFSTTNSGLPGFPMACGGSLGNAQGLVKGDWTNVDANSGENRVGFLTITDDGSDQITVTTSLRVIDSADSDHTENLTGPFVDTFDCAAYGAEPLFEDDFESYAVGTEPTGTGNGFAWTDARDLQIADDIAHTGTRCLRFTYGPEGGHRWGEQRFGYPDTQELWMEFYVYFPDGTEGFGARYTHAYPSASNNLKFISVWGNDYQGEPRAFFQLWSTNSPDYDSEINLGRSRGNDGSPVVFYGTPDTPFVTGEADRGRWIQVRCHFKVADQGVANGEFRLWKDGVLIQELTGDHWYDEAGTDNYLRDGYLMGWDNNQFAETTYIYIDNFKFYAQDPGW